MHIEIRLIKNWRIAINILYKRLSNGAFDVILLSFFKEVDLSTDYENN
jgi:hypothetical protein